MDVVRTDEISDPQDVCLDREEIRVDLERLRAVLAVEDPVKLKEAFQRLEGSAYRIADAIYADQQKTGA